MPGSPPPPLHNARFSQIDSLRAVACAMVVLSHTPHYFYKIARGGEWLAHLGAGRLGVLLFFAISGFVIPSSLKGLRWKGVKTFAIRRFWRLYPAFWIALLLTALFFRYPAERLPWDASMLPSLRRLANLDFAHGFMHFWTLEIEMFFYISVSILFIIFGRLGLGALLTSYIGVSIYTFSDSFPVGFAPEYAAAPSLMVMFWGSSCRELLRVDFSRYAWLSPINGVNWARSVSIALLAAPVLFLGIQYAFYRTPEGWGNIETRVGASLLCAVLGFLFWAILTPIRINWLSYVGRWTYSVYLFHWLVIYALQQLANSSEWGREVLRGWPMPVYVLSALIVGFGVAALLYRWVEQPSDRLGKRLSQSL